MVRRAHEDAACPVHAAQPARAWAWFGCRPGGLGECSSSPGAVGAVALGPLLRQTGGPRGELKSWQALRGRVALSGHRAFPACWWHDAVRIGCEGSGLLPAPARVNTA